VCIAPFETPPREEFLTSLPKESIRRQKSLAPMRRRFPVVVLAQSRRKKRNRFQNQKSKRKAKKRKEKKNKILKPPHPP
jgi:hypothetical protein